MYQMLSEQIVKWRIVRLLNILYKTKALSGDFCGLSFSINFIVLNDINILQKDMYFFF